jgi:4-amino-4-deoxy-L-arabinose transferase-like glycosyltransferase
MIHAMALDRWPAVTFDETLYSSPAYSLATTGRLAAPVLSGILGLESRYFLQPPGHSLVLAFVYKVFGFGIFQTRILGVVAAGLLVGTVYRFVLRMNGQMAPALAAGLLMWTDAPTVLAARSGRFDSLGIFLVLLGMSPLIAAPRNAEVKAGSRWLLLLSGGLCGAAVMVAPRVLLAVGCLWAARVLVRPKGLCGEIRALGPFVAGAVAAFLPWGIMIAGDVHTFLAQFPPHAFGSVNRAAASDISSLELSHALYVLPGIAALAVIVVRAVHWRRWGGEDRMLLVFVALHTFLFIPVSSRSATPSSFILAYFTPAVYLLTGLCCGHLDAQSGQRGKVSLWKTLVFLALVNWIGLSVARVYILAAEWDRSAYRRLRRDFDRVVNPCKGTIVGGQYFYYAAVASGCGFQYDSILLNLDLPGHRLEQLWANYRQTLSGKRDLLLVLPDGIQPQDLLLGSRAHRYRSIGRLCFPPARGLRTRGSPAMICASVYTDRSS